MDSKKVREEFYLSFYLKNTLKIASSSLVVKDDPTLMFVNAGMNQFKDIFLDYSKPKYLRVVNTQRCLVFQVNIMT